MFAHEIAAVPLELKFAGDAATGTFEGYGAVYGNQDAVGDVIQPSAFAAALAARAATGARLPMHTNHGLPDLGGMRGVGVWESVVEDGTGLRVRGRISGMNTDGGRLLFERVKDGAYAGLSVGYKTQAADYPREAGKPRRIIRQAALLEVSLVDDPANPLARVESIKSRLQAGDLPTEREFGRLLREACGLTRAQSEVVVGFGYKSLVTRRDGGGEEATTSPEVKAAAAQLRNALRFTLPSIR